MKRLRLDRWASQAQSPRNPRLSGSRAVHCLTRRSAITSSRSAPSRSVICQSPPSSLRQWSGTATLRQLSTESIISGQEHAIPPEIPQKPHISSLDGPRYTPSVDKIHNSAKLSALHARLALPAKLPVSTLARCLVDVSADPRPGFNNAPLALLGQDLLGTYTAEYLLCKYPRLPMPIVFAAQYGYAGSATLSAMRGEWGVETVAAPGQEVDPGLLQFKRIRSPNSILDSAANSSPDALSEVSGGEGLGTGRNNDQFHYRRGMSSRIVYDDQFGDLHANVRAAIDEPPFPGAGIATLDEVAQTTQSSVHGLIQNAHQSSSQSTPGDMDPTTLEAASASFVRALVGALYLHAGASASKNFHKDHILSRHLQFHTLFNFTHPTRDLSRLCLREGFEPPVARLISETGRHSRTPVYVVGVYSGNDKLGEGVGSSLNEGRVRAAAAALRSWYLYSPPAGDLMMPSDAEGTSSKTWKPQMIDVGEVVT